LLSFKYVRFPIFFSSDHDTVLLVRLVNLVDCVDEAGVSEREVLLDGEVPVLFAGSAHNFVETRVNDILLGGTLNLLALFRLVAHDLEQAELRLLLVLLGHLAGGDVFQILEPLKVRAGDTTAVNQKIGSANDTFLNKDLLGSVGGGAVSTLKDSLDLDVLGVTHVERLLDGGGDQVVSLLFDEFKRVLKLGLNSGGESLKGSVFSHVVLDVLHVEALGVVDSGVVLDDSGNLATILLEEFSGPVSNSAKTLNNKGTFLNTLGEAGLFAEGLVACQLADSVVDSETGGLATAADSALSDELTGAAALSINVLLTLDVHVGILDPGHNLLVGSHVGSEAIDSSTDETLLDELHSVLACNSFELTLGKLTGVDLDATLATTEWNVSDCELEGHKGRESLDFLEIDVVRVSGTALARELVGGVLSSVAGDSLKSSIVTTERDVESNDGLAGLNQVKVLLGDTGLGGGTVVEHFDLLEETGFTVIVKTGAGSFDVCCRELSGRQFGEACDFAKHIGS